MKKTLFVSFVSLASLFFACTSNDFKSGNSQYIPEVPDYCLEKMWFNVLNDTIGNGADVFYIPSTWEYDWTTPEGNICHYADVYNKEHTDNMGIEMKKVSDYMADGNNFYSPFYRHITLDTWATLNEETISNRYSSVSFPDVRNAFEYFIENFNNGRPFILAGFSQGGKSVVELMKIMPSEVRNRMVAAYVLGYKVTPDDISTAPWIVAAKDSMDTGVTICYNSVSNVKHTKPIVSSPNAMCINPVNWRTDSTPAILNDTITVTLNTEHKVLVLDGFDGNYLPNILDILNVGDYHGIEPWVYSECLRKNIRQRILSYRQKVNDK
jgi:hypothetical protein